MIYMGLARENIIALTQPKVLEKVSSVVD